MCRENRIGAAGSAITTNFHLLLQNRPMIDFPIVNGSKYFREIIPPFTIGKATNDRFSNSKWVKIFSEYNFGSRNNRFRAAGPGQFIVPTMPWPGNFFQTPSLLTYVGLSEFDFRNPDSHLLGKKNKTQCFEIYKMVNFETSADFRFVFFLQTYR